MLHCHDEKDRYAADEVAKFTAVWRWLSVLVLLFLPISQTFADSCPPRFSPPSYSEQLLIDETHWQAMQEQRDRVTECPQLAADFAQAYFWGGTAWSADFFEARQFADLANVAPSQKWQLRLLNAAFVLFDQRHDDLDTAIAVFQRELASENILRRQRAWAVLNQLATSGELRKSGDRYALELSEDGLLVSDNAGSIQRIGAGGYEEVDQRPPAVFYPRTPHKASALWQWPAAKSRLTVGQLYSYYENRQDGRCTATALSDRWVITAAHCLYRPEADAPLADTLRFFPQTETSVEAIGIEQLWMLQNNHRQLLDGDIAAYTGSDLALLRLEAAIPGDVIVPALGASLQSSLLYSYAFPENTPDASLWLSICKAVPKGSTGPLMGLLSLDCDSHPGQSGALLWQPGERLTGVAVLSANLTKSGETRAIAATFSAPLLEDIQRILRDEKPRAVYWRHVQR